MQTRSSLQRRSNSESSDRVVAHIKPRSWGDEHHEQTQTMQPQTSGFDFKNADWFSHDPGPRSPVRVFNTIQAKLKVGAPNDVYEQEADRVAEQVMSTPDSATHQSIQREDATEESAVQTKPLAVTITPIVQRDMAPEEEEPEPVQAKLIQRDMAPEEEAIQTKGSPDAGFQAGSNLENRLNSSQGGGSPLPDEVRSFMEPRFGADFSQVRVHTGSESLQMNQDLNAQAFTHKQDVYFGAGKAPANDALTAHELTHVVQQAGGIQAKYETCETLAETEKNREALIQTKPNNSTQMYVQRVHTENGRKKFDCPDFVGDSKLEACLNDEDRLRPLDTGSSVTKIQTGLQKDGQDLGIDGTKGVYDADTGKAVMAFKRKHNLGSTQFPDVGPGTTRKLDELCVGSLKPQEPKKPKPPKAKPP